MGKLNRLASDKIKGLRRSRTRTLRRGGRENGSEIASIANSSVERS